MRSGFGAAQRGFLEGSEANGAAPSDAGDLGAEAAKSGAATRVRGIHGALMGSQLFAPLRWPGGEFRKRWAERKAGGGWMGGLECRRLGD